MFNHHKKYKYINGVRGAVSLIMIVIMLPFLEIAAILVDLQRRNAAAAALDEIIALSQFSTMADYEDYLKNRFGLFATSQENDIATTFDNYFSYNLKAMSGTFGSNYTTTVKGSASLNNNDVLYSQIMEYCKFNAPEELMAEFLNIGSLLSSLEKKFHIGNLASTIGSVGGLSTDIAQYIDKIDALKELSDTIYSEITTYNNAFTAFNSAAVEYATALKNLSTAQDDLSDAQQTALENSQKVEYDEEGNQIEYDSSEDDKNISDKQKEVNNKQNEVNTKRQNLMTKKTEYYNTHNPLITDLKKYKTDMDSIMSTLSSMKSNVVGTVNGIANTSNEFNKVQLENELDEVNKQIQEISQNAGRDKYLDPHYQELQKKQIELQKKISDITMDADHVSAFGSVESAINESITNGGTKYSEEATATLINKLIAQQTTVNNFQASAVNKNTTGLSESTYHIAATGILTSSELDTLYQSFLSLGDSISDSLKSLWEGVKALISELLSLTTVYDPQLSAEIDVEYFLTNFELQIDATDAANPLLRLLNSIISFMTDLSETIALFPASIFWKLGDLCTSGKNLISSISDCISSVTTIISSFLNGTPYELIYYPAYLVYNLPCRTDFKSGKTMNEAFSFSSIEYASNSSWSTGLPIIQDIDSLLKLAGAYGEATTKSKMFCGAELEYIISGSNNEIENQAKTFGMLYILRMLLNISTIMSSPTVATVAGACSIGAPIVYILYFLLEPFIDMVMLVNNKNVDLIKSYAWISPSGLYAAIDQLCTPELYNKTAFETKMKDVFKGGNDNVPDPPKTTSGKWTKGLLQFSYKDYLLFILIIFNNVENEQKLLKNLIQMETLEYNRLNKFYSFNINKAYTGITSEATVDMKQISGVLTGNDGATITRKQSRSY